MGFGPDLSEDLRSGEVDDDEGDAGGPVGPDELVILPSLRMPPRGVAWASWGKEPYMHPFWALSRTAVPDEVNMSMRKVAVDLVVTMGMGALHLPSGKAGTHFSSMTIPVTTPCKVIEKGTVLALEAPGEQNKKSNTKSKTFQWDTVSRKSGPSSRDGGASEKKKGA